MTITSLAVAADHPAYPGHFPGMPVLPAVVMLDAVLYALEHFCGRTSQHWQLATAKFQSAVRPGETLMLEHETLPNGSVRFTIRTGDRPVASGILAPLQPHTGRDRGEQS